MGTACPRASLPHIDLTLRVSGRVLKIHTILEFLIDKSIMPDIRTRIDFLKDLPLYKTEKPFMVLLPANKGLDPDAYRTENLEFEKLEDVPIFDIRGHESEFLLDTSGFQLVRHDSQYLNILDRCDVENYRHETEEFLQATLGAEKVICWDVRVCPCQRRSFVL